MMTINSTFDVFSGTRPGLLDVLRALPREKENRDALLLCGIEVAIENDGRTFTLSSDTPPLESTESSRATAWPRWVFRLPNGTSIEQQMVLPQDGNAIAFSWRLLTDSPTPVTLAVTPVFSADQLAPATGFERESDAHGGRLTWQPNERSTEIIADTNGQNRTAPEAESSEPNVARPGTFEFALGRRPAVLIFSLAHQPNGCGDPIIGGFLAQLADGQLAGGEKSAQRIEAVLMAA